MELLNATKMPAGYTLGMEPSGQELLVVAVKGTFRIPDRAGDEAELAAEQKPLVMADTFSGEPGHSAPVHEIDFAPRKRRCDVLLLGSAYAPQGKPTNRVQVGLKIGSVAKTFSVVGDRFWEATATTMGPGYPGNFTVMPISYDCAFGGLDNFLTNPDTHRAYTPNPVGKGYHEHLSDVLVNGTPMPNTEELKRPVTMPNHAYRPMAFGPVGRNWEPRYTLAGTYDQKWLDDVFPFLPSDFDEGYYQTAPVDQQMGYPQGGEEVLLMNLTPQGLTKFRLPLITLAVVFFTKQGERKETPGIIDTVVLAPDQQAFTLTWRSSLPLKRDIFEIPQVLVGKMSRGRWGVRELGKTHYPSLAPLAKTRREPAEEGEE